MSRYVVVGPGWGNQVVRIWDGPCMRTVTGHIAYDGPSRADAERIAKRMHRDIRRLRRRPSFRDAADTYQVLYA